MTKFASIAKFPLLNASCPDCGLRKICLSRGLNGRELKFLDDIISSNLKYQAKTHLYHQGDPFLGIYAIKSGSTKSCIIAENGNEQIVGFQFPGDILGLDAFEHCVYTTSVIFLENSILCRFPFERFDILCDKIPRLHHILRQQASHEITHGHELLITIIQKTAEERIAFFLVEIAHHLHLHEQTEAAFHLPMHRKDIGNYLGLSQGSVSRTFAKFERDGMIKVSGKNVRITDMQGLEQFVSFCNRCTAWVYPGNNK